MSVAPKLRDRLREETSRAIIVAAEDVFATEGLSVAKVETIAERAGVSVGTLYNYFKDRDSLLASVSEARWQELLDCMRECDEAGQNRPFSERFERSIETVLENLNRHGPFFCRVMQEEMNRQGFSQGFKGHKHATQLALHHHFQTLIEEGSAANTLRSIDAALGASFALSLCRAVAIRYFEKRVDAEVLHGKVREVVEFFMNGVGRKK